MAGLVVVVAAESIFLTDATKMLFTMISDRYLKRERAKGRAEERQVGWNGTSGGRPLRLPARSLPNWSRRPPTLTEAGKLGLSSFPNQERER